MFFSHPDCDLVCFSAYYFADTVAATLIASVTWCTMWPIANCGARVLLNTTPPYVLAQLDKLLSETQTLGKPICQRRLRESIRRKRLLFSKRRSRFEKNCS